jgi:hypothetical protein
VAADFAIAHLTELKYSLFASSAPRSCGVLYERFESCTDGATTPTMIPNGTMSNEAAMRAVLAQAMAVRNEVTDQD